MVGIKNYLIAVFCAAILCTILKQITGKGSLSNGMLQLLSGLFVVICIIAPWKNFSISDLKEYIPFHAETAAPYVDTGKEMTQNKINAIISQKTEAYILEKANEMDVSLEVRVELSAEGVPERSVISGIISSEDREVLSAFLLNDVGIQREMQVWK